MFKRSYRRAFAGALLASALLIPALAPPALAETAGTGHPAKNKAIAKHKATQSGSSSKAAAPSSLQSGQVVSIDPATRKIRQATPEQIQALAASEPRHPLARVKELVKARNGGDILRFPPSALSYSVASKTADGKLKAECLDDAKSAKARMHDPAAHSEVLDVK